MTLFKTFSSYNERRFAHPFLLFHLSPPHPAPVGLPPPNPSSRTSELLTFRAGVLGRGRTSGGGRHTELSWRLSCDRRQDLARESRQGLARESRQDLENMFCDPVLDLLDVTKDSKK